MKVKIIFDIIEVLCLISKFNLTKTCISSIQQRLVKCQTNKFLRKTKRANSQKRKKQKVFGLIYDQKFQHLKFYPNLQV